MKAITNQSLRMAGLVSWASLLFIFSALILPAQATELAVGDVVPGFTANDQFDNPFKFEAGLRFLLLSFDRSTGTEANHKLTNMGAGWLDKQKAAFVLDIHAMPAVAQCHSVIHSSLVRRQ